MSYRKIETSYDYLIDANGLPLDSGYIYIGESGKNPKTDPITIYSDIDLTKTLAQPIRSNMGYLYSQGTPTQVFTSESDYSILIEDKNGTTLRSALTNPQTEIDTTTILQKKATLAEMIAVSSPSTGDAYIVTEDKRGGVFVYDSTKSAVNDGGVTFNGWVRQYSGTIYETWFDVTTGVDVSTEVQNIIDFMDSNDCLKVEFGTGTFEFSGITIPVALYGLNIFGQDSAILTDGTVFKNNNTTAMFTTLGTGTSTNVQFEKINFAQSTSTSGHIFDITDKLMGFYFKDINYTLINPNSSFFKTDAESMSIICMSNILNGRMAPGATVPGIDITNTGAFGNEFAFDFNNLFLSSNDTATAPIIKITDASGGATSGAHNFKNVVLELATNGGGIHLYSIRNPIFQNCWSADGTSNNAPVILVTKSATVGSQEPFGTTFIGCIMIGQGNATYPDVKVTCGGAGTHTTFIGCNVGYIDTDIQSATVISSNISHNVSTVKEITVKSGQVTLPSTFTIPEVQSGLTGVVTAGASLVVTFSKAFSTTPNVTASHNAGTTRDAPINVTSITATGFTLFNSSTSASTVQWIAVNP